MSQSPPTPDPVAWMVRDRKGRKMCVPGAECPELFDDDVATPLYQDSPNCANRTAPPVTSAVGVGESSAPPSSALPATTPSDEAQRLYEDLLAKKLEWFETSRLIHIKRFGDDPTPHLIEMVGEMRHFLPAAMHWIADVVAERLSGISPSEGSAPDTPGQLFRTPEAVKDAWGEVEELALAAGVDGRAWIEAVGHFWRVANLASEPVAPDTHMWHCDYVAHCRHCGRGVALRANIAEHDLDLGDLSPTGAVTWPHVCGPQLPVPPSAPDTPTLEIDKPQTSAVRSAIERLRSLRASSPPEGEDTQRLDWLEALLDRGAKTTDLTLWRDWDVAPGADPLYAISQSHWSVPVTGESLRAAVDAVMAVVDIPGRAAIPPQKRGHE